MRPYKVTVIATAAVLGGCHGPSAPKGPTNAVALFADLEKKFDALPQLPNGTKFDLRTKAGQDGLKAALAPFDATLDEAKHALDFKTYPEIFMPVDDFVVGKTAPPGSKNALDLKQGVFLKRLVKALCARARLEYTNGHSAMGLLDLKVSAQTINLFGEKQGSVLGSLVTVAMTEILLRNMQMLTLDTSLEKDELTGLAQTAGSIRPPTPFKTLIDGEQVWLAKHADKDPKVAAKDNAEMANVVAIFQDEKRPAKSILNAFSAKYPTKSIPTAPNEIVHMNDGRIYFVAYDATLRCETEARMTESFYLALSLNEKTGRIPSSLPASGNSGRDPFGDGALDFRPKKDGFTVSSIASRGYVFLANHGNEYHLDYPVPSYLPAFF